MKPHPIIEANVSKVRSFSDHASARVLLQPSQNGLTSVVAMVPKTCELAEGEDAEILRTQPVSPDNEPRYVLATAILTDTCFTCAGNAICNPYNAVCVVSGYVPEQN